LKENSEICQFKFVEARYDCAKLAKFEILPAELFKNPVLWFLSPFTLVL